MEESYKFIMKWGWINASILQHVIVSASWRINDNNGNAVCSWRLFFVLFFSQSKGFKADLPLNKEMDKNGSRGKGSERRCFFFYVAMGQLCLASFEFCPDPWSPWVGRGHTRGLGEVLLSASAFPSPFYTYFFFTALLFSFLKWLFLLEGSLMATPTFGYGLFCWCENTRTQTFSLSPPTHYHTFIFSTYTPYICRLSGKDDLSGLLSMFWLLLWRFSVYTFGGDKWIARVVNEL